MAATLLLMLHISTVANASSMGRRAAIQRSGGMGMLHKSRYIVFEWYRHQSALLGVGNEAFLTDSHFIAIKLECVTDGLQTLIRYSYRFDV